MITLDLWLLLAGLAETAFVDEIGQLLLHELFDLLNGFLEAIFGRARDVEVERRVLAKGQCRAQHVLDSNNTHLRCGHALVGVVVAASCDIFIQSVVRFGT